MNPENQTPLIPMDIQAERKFLGTLIIDKEVISDVMLSVTPEHFYSTDNKDIYNTICTLHIDNSPINPDTIGAALRGQKGVAGRTKLEEIGGAKTILSTTEGLGHDEHDYWKGIVQKKYEERKLLEFANEARRLALSSPDDVHGVRSKLEERLVGLSGAGTQSSVSIDMATDELESRINRYIEHPDSIIGYSTGFTRLDTCLDGLQPGNVTIIYAPSSRFKSLFATNIGWKLAEQNVPGLWFTTEMPRVQVLERLLQIESGLNLKWLRRDKRVLSFKKRIFESKERISRYPIHFCDTSALDVTDIRAEVNRHTRWNGIKYIIVDLVDHVSSSRYKDEMVNNQRVVMAAMKQMAKDYDIHVVLVSHITKGNKETRSQASLDVEEMIGSSAKYQDVDASISIAPAHMDDNGRYKAMQRDDILYKIANDGTVDVFLSVTKNRHGELANMLLELDFNKGGRFVDSNTFIKQPAEPEQKELDLDEE